MQQKGRGYRQPTQVGHAATRITHQEKPDTRLAAMALHTPTVKSERLAQQRIILQWLALLPMTGTHIVTARTLRPTHVACLYVHLASY